MVISIVMLVYLRVVNGTWSPWKKNNCLKNSVVMVKSNLLMPVAVPCCPLSQVNHLGWGFEPHITKKCRGLSSDLDVKPNINGITKIRKNQLEHNGGWWWLGIPQTLCFCGSSILSWNNVGLAGNLGTPRFDASSSISPMQITAIDLVYLCLVPSKPFGWPC